MIADGMFAMTPDSVFYPTATVRSVESFVYYALLEITPTLILLVLFRAPVPDMVNDMNPLVSSIFYIPSSDSSFSCLSYKLECNSDITAVKEAAPIPPVQITSTMIHHLWVLPMGTPCVTTMCTIQ